MFCDDLIHYLQLSVISVTPYLEVSVDLLQQSPGFCDVIGIHQLPLQDGQGNVRTGGQVWVHDRLQGHGRDRRAVGLVVALELYNLHVGQGLWTRGGRTCDGTMTRRYSYSYHQDTVFTPCSQTAARGWCWCDSSRS